MASISDTLGKFIHFGRTNTFNPFSNSKDLKLLTERCFSIPSTPTFANTTAISVSTGLISNSSSFLDSSFVAEILETDGTRLAYLVSKLGVIGSNAYPGELDILWFDVEGTQSDYWVNSKWKGKILRLSGKFEASAIIVSEMNKIHTESSNIITTIANTIKSNPPAIGATYTQWNINAIAPQSKWTGTTWSVVSNKSVLIKSSIFTNPVQNSTHWLDNATNYIECDCIGGGGGGGGASANTGGYAGGAGGESNIIYNGAYVVGLGGAGGNGSTTAGIGGYGGRGFSSTYYYAAAGRGGVPYNHGNNATGIGSGGGGGANNGTASSGRIPYYTGNITYSISDTFLFLSMTFNILSNIRTLTYTVGGGGSGGNGVYKGGAGSNGLVAIREYTTETVYVRTA